ncbi:MAG: trypsin-like peptidase domain-containing protein, partial [Candidatus Binatia bacterium]
MTHTVRTTTYRATVWVGLALTLGLPGTSAAADRAPREVVRGATSASDVFAAQRRLRGWLENEKPSRPPTSPIHIQLTPEERATLKQRATGAGAPLKVGLVRALSPGVAVSGLDRRRLSKRGRSVAGGTLAATDDGGFVWVTSVASEGAGGLRVHLSAFELPPNAALYFFGGSDEAYGPYVGRGPNGDGDFWTPSVLRSEAELLVRHFGPATEAERRQVSVVVSAVGHLEPQFPEAIEQAGTSFCGNPMCIVDASCLTNAAVADATNAVAQLEWVSGPFLYTCTGGLLADTDASTQIPYLLTANHCISRGKDARSLEAFFLYRTSACGDACPSNAGFSRALGATIRATGSAGDFTLLELGQTPPSGTVMLGWNKNPVAFTNGADLYRISHPNFGAQTFSHHRVDTSAPTCSSWPRGQRIYSRDVEGATDGGSSGSPVV